MIRQRIFSTFNAMLHSFPFLYPVHSEEISVFFISLLRSSPGLSNQFINPSVRFHTFNRALQNSEQTLKKKKKRVLDFQKSSA